MSDTREWRRANPERYKAGVKKANDDRRADPVKWARKLEQCRQWRERNREKLNEYDKNRDREKVNARSVIRNRIRRGTMKRGACEICGAANSQAHHPDYKKPLEVRWLCPQHHNEAHHE